MEYLFFTRSNGDVDSMPNDPSLVGQAERRAAVGDAGADDFQVLEDPSLKSPTFNGSEYVSNLVAGIKKQRDLDMANVTVSHNSKSWSFGPVDMSRFESKISRGRDFIWKADDGSHTTITPTQAQNIALKVDDVLTAIFFDSETAIAAL